MQKGDRELKDASGRELIHQDEMAPQSAMKCTGAANKQAGYRVEAGDTGGRSRSGNLEGR